MKTTDLSTPLSEFIPVILSNKITFVAPEYGTNIYVLATMLAVSLGKSTL